MHNAELAFVTDLDGTLMDTRAANRSAYAEAFERNGVPFDSDLYDSHFGLNFADMCNLLAPLASAAIRSRIAAAKSELYRRFFPMVQLNVGLTELLKSASRQGHPVGLATTARRENVDALLGYFDLHALFDASVTAGDVERGKPAPDCYHLAARRMAVEPAQVTVFEDSDIGIAAASAAGCNVIKVVM